MNTLKIDYPPEVLWALTNSRPKDRYFNARLSTWRLGHSPLQFYTPPPTRYNPNQSFLSCCSPGGRKH